MPRNSRDKITPEFPRAPRSRAPAVIFAASPTVAGSDFFSSLTAVWMVRLMLVPVSPSGTGNTFRSLMASRSRVMQAAPKRTICLNALPLILSVISLLLLWPGAYTVTESTHTLTSRTSTPVFLVTTYLTSLMMERQTVAILTPFSTTMCSSMETVPSSL